MAAQASGDAHDSNARDTENPDTSPDDVDETRRKFREALERKQARGSGGAAHTDAGGRQSHAHGPAEQRRTFRRKSGG